MISFNEEDINLKEISRRAKLFNLVTRYGYRVYGLKQENPCPIRLTTTEYLIDKQGGVILNIIRFFDLHGLKIEQTENNARNDFFRIGLRVDLRHFPVFCAAAIQTIVYTLEGRIKLDDKFKIKRVPVLKA